MSNIGFAVNVVLPLFMLVAVGMLARRLGWIPLDSVAVLNKLCFYLLLPAMLIKSALQSDISQIGDPWLYVYGIGCFLLVVPLLMIMVPRYVSSPAAAGAFIHGAFRSNSVLIGIPLAINLFGEGPAFDALLLCMLMGPIFNILGVVVLARFSGGERPSARRMTTDILTNPLVISVVLGVAGSLAGVQLPPMLESSVNGLAAAATPIAMLAIGARFEARRLAGDLRLVISASAIKLVILPLIFVTAAALLGFRGVHLGGILIVYGTPSAVSSGIVTEIMGGDGPLGNGIILVSTAAAVFTLVIWISILQALALL